eukprot:2031850-Prymnesium_polylepis.2
MSIPMSMRGVSEAEGETPGGSREGGSSMPPSLLVKRASQLASFAIGGRLTPRRASQQSQNVFLKPATPKTSRKSSSRDKSSYDSYKFDEEESKVPLPPAVLNISPTRTAAHLR